LQLSGADMKNHKTFDHQNSWTYPLYTPYVDIMSTLEDSLDQNQQELGLGNGA